MWSRESEVHDGLLAVQAVRPEVPAIAGTKPSMSGINDVRWFNEPSHALAFLARRLLAQPTPGRP